MARLKKRYSVLLVVLIMSAIVAMAIHVFASATSVSTFDELKAAVANGGEIQLANDITDTVNGNGQLRITKDTTIDLNGKTLKFAPISTDNVTPCITKGVAMFVSDGAKVTFSNGVINASADAGVEQGYEQAICIKGDYAGKTEIASTVTLKKVKVTGCYDAITVLGKGATLNVDDGSVVSACQHCISGNGSANLGGTTININGGEIKAAATGDTTAAIYHPQAGTLNITGGTIEGYDGVQFKGGTLTMTGGKITASGTKPATLEDNNNGSVSTAAALSFVSNKNYAGQMKLNISGNAELSASGSYALWEDTSVGSSTQTVSVNISGGKFTGTPKAVYFKNRANIPTFSVSGGTYSSDPTEYKDSDCSVESKDGKYTIYKTYSRPVALNVTSADTGAFVAIKGSEAKVDTDNWDGSSIKNAAEDALTVNINDSAKFGEYRSWTTSSVDIYGNVKINLLNGDFTATASEDHIIGTSWSSYSNGTVHGNVTLTLGKSGQSNDLVKTGRNIGAAGRGTVTGNTSTIVESGLYGGEAATTNIQKLNLVGGAYSGGIINGNSSLIVNGGKLKGQIFLGGSFSQFGGTKGSYPACVTGGDTSVVINGGEISSIENYPFGIVGGSYSQRGNTATVNGNSSVTVTGGTINSNIYGGPVARNKSSDDDGANSTVKGNSSVTVSGDAGLAALKAGISVYAGANETTDNRAQVKGDAKMLFSNIKTNIAAVTLDGSKASTGGDTILEFNNVSADFSAATIKGFKTIILPAGSKVVLNSIESGVTIKLTGDWTNIDASNALTVKSGSNVPTIDKSGATGIENASWGANGLVVTVNVPVTGITISGANTVVEDSSITLTAAVTPNNATTKTVTWTSSNTAVATVSDAGVVKGVKAGTATITAKAKDASGKTAALSVTVKAKTIPVTSITLAGESSVVEGSSTTLTATITPENATNKNVTWSSSSETTATVSGGVVTGVKAGTATITATAADGSKITGTKTITVTAKATTGDTSVTTPVTPTLPSGTNATPEQAVTAITLADETITNAGITADIAETKNGSIYIKDSVVEAAAANSGVSFSKVYTMPVFKVEDKNVKSGGLMAVAFEATGDKFGTITSPDKVELLKIFPNGTSKLFSYISSTGDAADKTFMIMNEDDTVATVIDSSKTYKIVAFIADNGAFDLDKKDEGVVVDPIAILATSKDEPEPTSGDSGGTGSCNAGFGALALLAVVPLFWRKRK